MSICDKLIQGE